MEKQFNKLKKHIKNPLMILDVGAGIGEFSKHCLNYFPDSKVYAFEPNRMLDLNEKVKWFSFALGNFNGKIRFYQNLDESRRSSIFKPNKKYMRKLVAKDEKYLNKDVQMLRFDSLGIKIQHPCFLKIDVEGADYEVLEGFGKMLKEVDFVQIEFYKKNVYTIPDRKKVLQILEENGFKLIEILHKHRSKRLFTIVEERLYRRVKQ